MTKWVALSFSLRRGLQQRITRKVIQYERPLPTTSSTSAVPTRSTTRIREWLTEAYLDSPE